MSLSAKFESSDGDWGEYASATIVSTDPSRSAEVRTEYTLFFGNSSQFDGLTVSVTLNEGTEDEREVELVRLTDQQIAAAINDATGDA